MYEKAFSLEIIAPDRVVFQGEATSVSPPGSDGSFQVLFNHAALMSSLCVGPLRVKDREGRDSLYATGGGFFEVRDNKAVALVESAEKAEDIDVQRAMAAKERAEQRLKSHDPAFEIIRAELALERALNRLRLAGRT